MNRHQLVSLIREKKSFLCVGLDPDLEKIPTHLLQTEDPIFEFNKAIIDATRDYCVAYKPNIAFYECLGQSGWESLEKTVKYIGEEHFTIADAKRGDIGNTSERYAKTFFETYSFDSITVAPYMGSDSVTPFFRYKEKWVILLGLTSNEGALDFQTKSFSSGEMLFESVLKTAQTWGDENNLMFVVGATKADYLKRVREIAPNSFLLVPGVGAQGGSLEEVAKLGMNEEVGLLVNSSRGILYASNGEDFAEAAAKEAEKISKAMAKLLS
jgi:orotidine-5'-phosphate decarboxylase